MEQGHETIPPLKKMPNVKRNTYRCSLCLTYYKSKKTLRQHKEEIHLGIKPLKKACPICGIEQSKLSRHLKTKHEENINEISMMENGDSKENDSQEFYQKGLKEAEEYLNDIELKGKSSKYWVFRKDLKRDLNEFKELIQK